MHDGVVRTFIEVCHILKLKKNIASMGPMDLKGFPYWVEGGLMKIIMKKKSMVM